MNDDDNDRSTENIDIQIPDQRIQGPYNAHNTSITLIY